MGGLFDALGEAVGVGQVKNGLNGPKLSFGGNKSTRAAPTSANQKTFPYASVGSRHYQGPLGQESGDAHPTQPTYTQYDLHGAPPPYSESTSSFSKQSSHRYVYSSPDPNTDYPASSFREPSPAPSQQWSRGYQYQSTSNHNNMQSRQQEELNRLRDLGAPTASRNSFRPLALPQVAFGSGQPFLRGYSDELLRFGISEADLITVVDALNVAVVPNPEIALGQKAAGIAGWFVPGFGAIGMMAGQVGVGVGAALGHASIVNKVLSKANLELFVPRGLEICIAKTKNVDEEAGRPPNSENMGLMGDTSPEAHISTYGDLLAPLSVILAPLENYGRTDPLATFVKRMNNHSAKNKVQRAREEMGRGDNRELERLGRHLKWVMIRKASANAVQHWQKTLEESNVEMESEQQAQRLHHR